MELPAVMEEQRKNNTTVLWIGLGCIIFMAYIFYLQKELVTKQDMLDTRMQTIEQYQIERIEIARRLLLKDSLARLRHDSIESYEGKGRAEDKIIRDIKIKELKKKGLWKDSFTN